MKSNFLIPSKMDVSENYLENLPYVLFRDLAINNMTGTDFILLCSTNNAIASYCLQNDGQIYADFIERDFDVPYTALDIGFKPEILYKRMIKYKQSLNVVFKLGYKDNSILIARYWLRTIPEIILLIRQHYPIEYCPKWVNYPAFKNDLILKLVYVFIKDVSQAILDEEEKAKLYFDYELALAYGSEKFALLYDAVVASADATMIISLDL
jgi:hypothetical protein